MTAGRRSLGLAMQVAHLFARGIEMNRSISPPAFAALALVTLAFTPAPGLTSAHAAPVPQERTALVVGVVEDTSGIPLPNVTVVLAELRRGTTTNVQGEFAFRGLPPGTYHLDARSQPRQPAPTRSTLRSRRSS
jgi:hypothetical protein